MSTPEKEKNIWTESNDVLDRHRVANYLTNYMVKRYAAKPNERGFVLAVDAEWGFGKTFLLQNWRKELIQTGYCAVYFDAWKNDFTPEPLIAFIAELNKNLAPLFKHVPAAEKLFRTARENISRFWKPITLIAAGAGLRLTTGLALESLGQVMSNGDIARNQSDDGAAKEAFKKTLEEIFDETLKQHESKKESIEEFRNSMEVLVSALEKNFQLPLFVFIDELDRCRPDYAIELLEGIKHLFGIPGIYFVVATNLSQLGESTKAVYGQTFDGHRYLKRFFDMEYSLPKPEGLAFARGLFERITCPSEGRIATGFSQNNVLQEEQKSLPFIFSRYADFFARGLRDQQQIVQIVEAAFFALQDKKIHIHYLFFLAMLYHRSPAVYEAVVSHGSLDASTGYSNLNTRRSKGLFETREPSDAFQPMKTKTTDINEIASLYLKSANENLLDITQERINFISFPQNLRGSLGHEMQGAYTPGVMYLSSVAIYPDIVRQAGGFFGPRE